MELSLRLAPHGAQLQAVLVWSEETALTDTLRRLPTDTAARLHEGALPPNGLIDAQRSGGTNLSMRILGKTAAPAERSVDSSHRGGQARPNRRILQ